MDLERFSRNARVNLTGLGIAALYGMTIRFIFTSQKLPRGLANVFGPALLVMTVAFLFAVPFAMGYVAVTARFHLARATNQDPPNVAYWIFFPWLPAVAAMLLAALFAWEGSVCLLFAAPIMLILASVGGVSAGFAQRRQVRPVQLSAVALLPLLLVLLEDHVPDPLSYRTVETAIRIHASAVAVWTNIIRVPAIQPTELPSSWVRTVGFPRPVEATLSHEGVGGVRHASFTGGLVFTETIDRWDPLRDLSFSIHANTSQIPPTTLDEHVKVGGHYFDVLEGEYRLEALPDGNTLLHLSSRERVSTHFNAYAGFWTDAVMRSIQSSILHVIQRRAETQDVKLAHTRDRVQLLSSPPQSRALLP
jgi:hypothetical protein